MQPGDDRDFREIFGRLHDLESARAGNGLPDPSGEPDGSWIRTASGVAVWVPSVTASEIDFVPVGTIGATDVQAAIAEVAAEASGAVSSVFTRTGAVTAATSDYDAVQVDFTPAGTIAATNVQAAIEEVATEAGGGVPTSRTLTAGAALTGGGDLTTNRTFDVAVDGSTIEVSSDALRVKAGGIGANEIAATAVTAGSYGDATHVGAFTVDADGRLTAASSVAITGGSSGYLGYIMLQDQKTNGSLGGTATSGSWATRTLNTEVIDTNGDCSLSSNQITLAAGTYEAFITCPAFYVSYHKTRLYNTTASATVLVGTTEYAVRLADGPQTRSFIIGRFTIAASQALEVQHRVDITRASDGFGLGFTGSGEIEVFTIAEFRRVS